MPDTIEGLDPALASIVDRIIAESNGEVTISSGFRSRDEQQALYDAYKSGKGNLAAKPGTSHHEYGGAVDFGGNLQLAGQLARKYGLVNSVPGEPWHFTLGSEDGPHTQRHSEYDLSPDTSSNPQDVLANRLNAVLRIIGQSSGSSAPTTGDPDVDRQLLTNPDATMDEGLAEVGRMGPMGGTSTTTSTLQPAGPRGQFQQYARKQLTEQYGMDDNEMAALITLWNKESGWNPSADNPTSTAFGIAQFLDSTWKGTGFNKTTDPKTQIDAGLRYITQRYGSPSAALKFHLANGYY